MLNSYWCQFQDFFLSSAFLSPSTLSFDLCSLLCCQSIKLNMNIYSATSTKQKNTKHRNAGHVSLLDCESYCHVTPTKLHLITQYRAKLADKVTVARARDRTMAPGSMIESL